MRALRSIWDLVVDLGRAPTGTYRTLEPASGVSGNQHSMITPRRSRTFIASGTCCSSGPAA